MLLNIALSALANVIVLGGVPLLAFALYHKWRNRARFPEALAWAGLQRGDTRYVWICAAAALLVIAALIVWPPPLEPLTREGSAQRRFAGLGLNPRSVTAALLYGVVQTGFSEELLFRGVIPGALARILSERWTNLVQAVIFLIPHLLIVMIMPEVWPILLLVFGGALFTGWARLRSGSVLGPWLLHASANVTVALSVAARSGV
jgi:membrane protease YdiL (CAAX protease family)